MKSIALEFRDALGKGEARRARGAGRIPCVVYGLKKTPVACSMEKKKFEQISGADLYNVAFEVNIAGKAEKVLCRAVQLCPVTEHVLHVDFMRVEKGLPVIARVPIEFSAADKCPGLKKKGTQSRKKQSIGLVAILAAHVRRVLHFARRQYR